MEEDDRAVEWWANRRRRTFLVSGTILGAIALAGVVALLLGVDWAAGFVGGFGAVSATLLLIWRGERRAARPQKEQAQE